MNININNFYNIIKKKYPDRLHHNKININNIHNANKLDTNFLNNEMSNELNNYKYIWKILYENSTIYINSSVYINNDKLLKLYILPVIRRILFIRNLTNNYYPIEINIWLSNYKKYLPKNKGDIIDITHVNSGSCTIYDRKDMNGEIYIWRKEELLKVLLHELLHSTKVDYHFNHNIDKLVKNKFNINDNINVNESYTEILATLFHHIINSKNYNDYIKRLNKQIKYSNNQMNNILIHNGYNDINELLRNKTNKTNKIFKQNTSVFSYYILKTLLLNNNKIFIKFLMDNDLIFHPKNTNKYYKLLLTSFNKCRIKNGYKDNTKRYIKNNSLKMTI